MNPQDIEFQHIPDNEWGNVFRVDLEVSMEMQDDYEAAFADEDMDPGSLYTMDVAVQMDNGEVSLVHAYEDGPLYDFEEDLFALYKAALGVQASKMVNEDIRSEPIDEQTPSWVPKGSGAHHKEKSRSM